MIKKSVLTGLIFFLSFFPAHAADTAELIQSVDEVQALYELMLAYENGEIDLTEEELLALKAEVLGDMTADEVFKQVGEAENYFLLIRKIVPEPLAAFWTRAIAVARDNRLTGGEKVEALQEDDNEIEGPCISFVKLMGYVVMVGQIAKFLSLTIIGALIGIPVAIFVIITKNIVFFLWVFCLLNNLNPF